LNELLLGGQLSDVGELQGRSFLDFVASEEEANKLKGFLAGTSLSAGQEPAERQEGPASVIVIELKDSAGSRFLATIYHACVGSTDGAEDGSRAEDRCVHLLGVRLQGDPALEREPPPAEVGSLGMPWPPAPVEGPRERRRALAGLIRAPSTSSESEGSLEMVKLPRCPLLDPSRIALRFDAGSTGYFFSRSNVFIGAPEKDVVPGLLDLVSKREADAVDQWVFQEVSRHMQAATRDEPWQPMPFPRPLVFALPARRLKRRFQSPCGSMGWSP